MEELYLQQGLSEMVNTISSSIAARLESLGLKTAKHVHDYLDDKYKRDYSNLIIICKTPLAAIS